MIAGIPTVFRGVEYRSRLEARWAAFFDGIGWQATYEPFDGEGYIPDFVIAGEVPLIVEVKPAVTRAQFDAAIPRVTSGLRSVWQSDIYVCGMAPLPMLDNGWCVVDDSAGLILEHMGRYEDERWIGWEPDIAQWFTCLRCKHVAVRADMMHFGGRPCGHYDGDSFIGPMPPIVEMWAEACNEVKWRGKPKA